MGEIVGTVYQGFVLDKKQNLIGRGARGYEILDAQKQVIGHLKLDGSVVNIKNVEIGKLQPDGRIMDAGGRVIAVAEKLQYYQKPVEPETEMGLSLRLKVKGKKRKIKHRQKMLVNKTKLIKRRKAVMRSPAYPRRKKISRS